jgi:EAL domain-containing protein (putative c-di-GMP-specific phosphodiesterase class I)
MSSMLENEELQLHYQLQYTLGRQIRGMEALLRLPDAKKSFASPDTFITLAEDSGLIHPLGKWVLERVCRQLKAWNSKRELPVHLAFNISPLQLMRRDFVDEVQQAVSRSGIDLRWLEMEITERVVLNVNEIADRMAELAGTGIRFAVDDFGTG